MTHRPLVIFDLVATLTDAGPRYAQAYVQMCEVWNVTMPDGQEVLAALGEKNLKQIINAFTPDLPPENTEAFMQDCNHACDTLLYNVNWHEDLYPNVRNALARLHDAGWQLGIFTGTREDMVVNQLRYHNIIQYFKSGYIRAKDNARDGMIDTNVLKAKQLSEIVRSYAEDHGISLDLARQNILVIGDSPSDFFAAQEQDLNFFGFAASSGAASRFARQAGIPIFSDYRMLPDMLQNWNESRNAVPSLQGCCNPGFGL
jgi:phosphoglycolate phosphatase-like HAD superfamily hydrolase